LQVHNFGGNERGSKSLIVDVVRGSLAFWMLGAHMRLKRNVALAFILLLYFS
jgi:hypothetical protein